MAKANLVLPSGTKVNIEGTAEEVGILLTTFSQPSKATSVKTTRKERSSKAQSKVSRTLRKGPKTLITELANEEYFKSKHTIGDIQKILEQRGYIYTTNNLSTPLLRLVKSRVLRRIKENNCWVYVD